jgi:hypothetical protein
VTSRFPLKKTKLRARRRSVLSSPTLAVPVHLPPPPPLTLCRLCSVSQAFADELHAREFRLPRREVECLTHKRAVMQAGCRTCPRFTSSYACAVLCGQRRQRARLRSCCQSSCRMQQRFARESVTQPPAVGGNALSKRQFPRRLCLATPAITPLQLANTVQEMGGREKSFRMSLVSHESISGRRPYCF